MQNTPLIRQTAEDLDQALQTLSQQLSYHQAQHEKEIEELKKAADAEKESALRIHKAAVSLPPTFPCQHTRVILTTDIEVEESTGKPEKQI